MTTRSLLKRTSSTGRIVEPPRGATKTRNARPNRASGMKVLERDVLKSILDYCAVEKIFIHRRNVGAVKADSRYIRFSKPGMADLWGIYRRRHIECEVKRPGEVPSKAQLDWLVECDEAGACAFWCDSLDGFIRLIKEIL